MSEHEDKARREALERFGDLLNSGDTLEREWQALFSENPFILTESLPLRITAVYPELTFEAGRPDFVFSELSSSGLGYYGVIELKRPSDTILRVYSPRHVYPSAKLSQAHYQVEHYLKEMAESARIGQQFTLALASSQHAFIILGRSAELLAKCQTETAQKQLRNLLPRGINLMPFDTLFERFRSGFSPAFVLQVLPHDAGGAREPQKFFQMLDEYAGFDYAVLTVVHSSGWARVPKGNYRHVFGVPRKIWPMGEGRFREFYEYELRERIGPDALARTLEEAKEFGYPYEALELSGEFLSEDARWGDVVMKLRAQSGEIGEQLFRGWDFALYEGDKLYREDDALALNADSTPPESVRE